MESSLPINPLVKKRGEEKNQSFLRISESYLLFFPPSSLPCFLYREEPSPDPGVFWSLEDQYRTSRVLRVRYEGHQPAVGASLHAACLYYVWLKPRQCVSLYWAVQKKKNTKKKEKTSIAAPLGFSLCAFKPPTLRCRAAWSLACNELCSSFRKSLLMQ